MCSGFGILERHHEASARIPSFGQSCGRGLGRRTTWRRFGGSCAMTSDFSRRIMMTCKPRQHVSDADSRPHRLQVSKTGRSGQHHGSGPCPGLSLTTEVTPIGCKSCRDHRAPSSAGPAAPAAWPRRSCRSASALTVPTASTAAAARNTGPQTLCDSFRGRRVGACRPAERWAYLEVVCVTVTSADGLAWRCRRFQA